MCSRLDRVKHLIDEADVDLLNCPQEPLLLRRYLNCFDQCRTMKIVYAFTSPPLSYLLGSCTYLNKVGQLIAGSDLTATTGDMLNYLTAAGCSKRVLQVSKPLECHKETRIMF